MKTLQERLILSNDEVWIEAEELANIERMDLNGLTIFSGTHPEHGLIDIIIPALGAVVIIKR